MEWDNYIHSDPNVLLGKPVVKGTRLSVEFILGLYFVERGRVRQRSLNVERVSLKV
ncbi:MAG: DUF433 domain-containing protein [Desulfobacteraceae bacterium]|nr:MAG: DUF433 domain-containing protein [Desulfobacteraceae bacterium]